MGLYDMLSVEGAEGAQLKCWDCEMKRYGAGDGVPQVGGLCAYAAPFQK